MASGCTGFRRCSCERSGSCQLPVRPLPPFRCECRDHLSWVKSVHDGIGPPMIWWQVPFGVPSATPGGTSGHYRDDRVHYMFSHFSEFVAAGGVGAVFGTGAGNQTYIDTDGGQFKAAVTKYFAAPVALQ